MVSNRGYWFYKSIKITSETQKHNTDIEVSGLT